MSGHEFRRQAEIAHQHGQRTGHHRQAARPARHRRRAAMAWQVGRDERETVGQQRDQVTPAGARRPGAVQQQQHGP
jgi:hypothetical protein